MVSQPFKDEMDSVSLMQLHKLPWKWLIWSISNMIAPFFKDGIGMILFQGNEASQPSKDRVNHLHNDVFLNDNSINPHLLPSGFSTIHYRFICIFKNILETMISSWF